MSDHALEAVAVARDDRVDVVGEDGARVDLVPGLRDGLGDAARDVKCLDSGELDRVVAEGLFCCLPALAVVRVAREGATLVGFRCGAAKRSAPRRSDRSVRLESTQCPRG
jgi:hypothetical protein